jgi:site-specific DNA-methyltransferase (adenine-specific)
MMKELNQVIQMDCLKAMTELPDQSVDVTLTDPPYPNRMRLFTDSIVDGYAGLYLACRKTKNYVVFFWSNDKIPQAPPGWYEVARHIWHKPDCKSITHYENIIVWARDWKRKISRVWSIPILDYRSLRDWKPHPTQKPVRLIRYLLEMYSKEGDIVLDPFVGTGTTAVACKQMKRDFIAIDNNQEYANIAKERLTSRHKEDIVQEQPEAKTEDLIEINDQDETLQEELPEDPIAPEYEEEPELPTHSRPDTAYRAATHRPLTKPKRTKTTSTRRTHTVK